MRVLLSSTWFCVTSGDADSGVMSSLVKHGV
jgi:hypothetical protein